MTELDLISKIKNLVRAKDHSVVCGIGDDSAVLKFTKDAYLLFTADMLIEGIDFKPDTLPQEIGHKALGCSLSDIAAMAGTPKYALVSLGLPGKNPAKFIDGFYKGALKLVSRFNTHIVGGDLSASSKIVVNVSMVGYAKRQRLVLRSGARPGDMIFVTGSLGGSIYGKHLNFIPRIKEAEYLSRNYKINAMIDISDGLGLDLYRLSQASSVGAVIYEGLIPVSKEAKTPSEALYMGEDFELLFTLPEKEARRLVQNQGSFFRKIGEIKDKGYGLRLIASDGREKPLRPKGYQHF